MCTVKRLSLLEWTTYSVHRSTLSLTLSISNNFIIIIEYAYHHHRHHHYYYYYHHFIQEEDLDRIIRIFIDHEEESRKNASHFIDVYVCMFVSSVIIISTDDHHYIFIAYHTNNTADL